MNGFETPIVNFLASTVLLYKVLLNFFIGHDSVEQVSIGLALAHCQAFVQVVLVMIAASGLQTINHSRHRAWWYQPVCPLACLLRCAIRLEIHLGGWHCNTVKVRIHRQSFLPQLQELAAAFTHTLRPDSWIGSHHSLQSANSHAVLRPVTRQVWIGRQEVDMTC